MTPSTMDDATRALVLAAHADRPAVEVEELAPFERVCLDCNLVSNRHLPCTNCP